MPAERGPVHLRCRDLAYDADILLDLFSDGTWRHHSAEDLDGDRCLCHEAIPRPHGWDVEARREWNRRCHDPMRVERPGFVFTACCSCADEAAADDDVIEVACRRILRVRAQSAHYDPAAAEAVKAYRAAGATMTEAQLAVALDRLHGEVA